MRVPKERSDAGAIEQGTGGREAARQRAKRRGNRPFKTDPAPPKACSATPPPSRHPPRRAAPRFPGYRALRAGLAINPIDTQRAAAPALSGRRVSRLETLRRKALGLCPKPQQGHNAPAPHPLRYPELCAPFGRGVGARGRLLVSSASAAPARSQPRRSKSARRKCPSSWPRGWA